MPIYEKRDFPLLQKDGKGGLLSLDSNGSGGYELIIDDGSGPNSGCACESIIQDITFEEIKIMAEQLNRIVSQKEGLVLPKLQPFVSQGTIQAFSGKYGFLSNFHVHGSIAYSGLDFNTVEAAFQAQKVDMTVLGSIETKASFQRLNASDAKRLGRRVKLRSDWEQIKDQVMLDLLRLKFAMPLYANSLLSTGTAVLIEGNTWGDTYWGVCQGRGQNKLGQLLMQVRSEIGAQQR